MKGNDDGIQLLLLLFPSKISRQTDRQTGSVKEGQTETETDSV